MPHPPHANMTHACNMGDCDAPLLKYTKVIPSEPGYQWDDAGGYCGSWASQRALLAKGAWVSEQQVRDHTSPCGGHDNEILSCNIEEAYKNLHIDYNAFDYKNTPVPQSKAYNAWLKKQLAAGYPVVWMILWSLQSYPIYDLTPPAGMYGHVEPVIGISSDHPLDDETVYENDRVLHYDDAGLRTISRTFDSLPARRWDGPGHPVLCQGWYSYCIGYPYGFGWAIKGFTDAKEDVAMAASLSISPSRSEPDTRAGQKPAPITGTLTATGLTSGAKYDIYRWDSAATAFTYTDAYKKTSFTAAEATYQYADPDTFMSNSATYYRVLPAQQ
eukprot:TRINITY_DN6473_c0_g1_i2.p2 TRINITY_DN6473_c0_g1~~TRINITY_DN6473_c0_g1_i2.p2  ORF type:complete len:363 (+),score=118.00 TRINITY_DN6473_c0_g1_i2:104-1090(+)